MDAYKKLALTEEQKKVLSEVQNVMQKATEAKLCFIESPGYGCFAYNAKGINCFNAPKNAAYDNEPIDVDITRLEKAFRFGLPSYDILSHDETKCLVAFD